MVVDNVLWTFYCIKKTQQLAHSDDMKRMRSAVFGLFWVLALSTSLAACAAEDIHTAKTSFLANKQVWDALGWENYDYTVQRQCFCPAPYVKKMRVHVRAGKVVSAVTVEDNLAVDAKILSDLKTINDWFALINKELQRPAEIVDVKYQSQFGYPLRIHIDISRRVADDEQVIVISQVDRI